VGPGRRDGHHSAIAQAAELDIYFCDPHSPRQRGTNEASTACWTRQGQLKPITKVFDGLDAAPAALVAMLAGENIGQVVVRVGPDPT
jgi:NADPH-dependent curcumin reductase CurA